MSLLFLHLVFSFRSEIYLLGKSNTAARVNGGGADSKNLGRMSPNNQGGGGIFFKLHLDGSNIHIRHLQLNIDYCAQYV